MKLYSSAFITVVFAFLSFVGAQGQPAIVVQNPTIPAYTNIIRPEFIEENTKDSSLMSTPLVLNIDYFDQSNCFECDSFYTNTFLKLKEKYEKENWVNFHIYFTPDKNNETEMKAIMGVKCAASQNKFWEMLNAVHSGEAKFEKGFYQEFSKNFEMNIETFHACLVNQNHLSAIETDIKTAESHEIKNSPSLIINHYKLIGNQPIENVEMIINEIVKRHDS